MTIHRSGCRRKGAATRSSCAFTLIEVLAVIAIISFLIAIVLPVISRARAQAQLAICMARQGQLASAVHSYALSNGRRIPYGPIAGPGTLTNYYPITGSVTPLISLAGGTPVGLGLLFGQHMAQNPEAVFCPDSDQPFNASLQLSRVGNAQAQGSFIYRHGSSYYFEPATHKRLQIDKLGLNRFGGPLRALAVDSNMIAGPGMEMFGIVSRTHHQRRYANVMYADGHSKTLSNATGQMEIDLATLPIPQLALERMLMILEWADAQ